MIWVRRLFEGGLYSRKYGISSLGAPVYWMRFFVMISGNRSRRDMRAFSCAVSGFLTLIAWSLGSTRYTGSYFVVRSRLSNAPVQWKFLFANKNEFPRIREQNFAYVTSFSCNFVALTWYLCFQCLRWRITYRKFTKNSTTKASKQERYNLVFVMLTCFDFTSI